MGGFPPDSMFSPRCNQPMRILALIDPESSGDSSSTSDVGPSLAIRAKSDAPVPRVG